MFKRRTRVIASLFFLLASYTSTALAEKIVVYADDAYAPIIYLEHGKAKGILPDIFTRISKDTGDTYELILVPWARALQESKLGKGGITNFSFTKERATQYDFSESIYTNELQLVVLKGHEFIFESLKDLKGKTIGGPAGASFGDEIDKAINNGSFVLERDPHQQSRLLKLLHGRIDAAIIGNAETTFEPLFASSLELKSNRDKFKVLSNPLTSDPIYLAFLKTMNMKPALARFNKALIALKKTKEYKQIIMRQDVKR